MSEYTYDISYLFESELAQFITPVSLVEKGVRQLRTVQPSLAELEAARALELIALDPEHEAFIQQFMQFGGRFS